MNGTTGYALTMLIAGIGIPVFAAINSQLGQKIGNPFATGIVTFGLAFTIGLIAALLTGPSAIARLGDAPKVLLTGGFFVAFYVLSITFVAPRFGVGNAVFFVLVGQLFSAAAIDHFGLFGAQVAPLGAARAAGIALMCAGVWLTQQA